jgi:hypothetical protein
MSLICPPHFGHIFKAEVQQAVAWYAGCKFVTSDLPQQAGFARAAHTDHRCGFGWNAGQSGITAR